MQDDKLNWREVERKWIRDCRIFRLAESRQQDHCGREQDFFVLAAPDWVSVVPVVSDDQGQEWFLMVRQYRFGIGRVTLEFPAGLVDPEEEPAAAAAREVLEETGYRCESLKATGVFAANPAFMDNRVHFFVARGLEQVAKPQEDERERLQHLLVAPERLARELGTGELINPNTFVAYHLFLQQVGES